MAQNCGNRMAEIMLCSSGYKIISELIDLPVYYFFCFNLGVLKCLKLEMLNKAHSQKLYDKVKELQPRKHRVMHQIKDKNDRLLLSKTEIVERWAEYVEELYEDNRADKDMGDAINEKSLIGENEVKEVIDNLPKKKR